jgi:signal transduction histidine kinase
MDGARIRFEDLQEDEVSRAIGKLLAMRVVLFPVALTLVTVFALFDAARWRQAILIPFLGASLVFAVVERRRFRLRGATKRTVAVNVIVQLFILSVVVTLTGGVRSALIPAMVVMVFVETVLLPTAFARRVLAMPCAFLLALGTLQALGPPGAARALEFGGEMQGAGPAMTLTRTGVCVFLLFSAYSIARVIRVTFEAMAMRALAARDEALQSYADEARSLTTLAGEIAHELKNPLASVKGLAGLLVKDVAGRAAECLDVMRREIDRMQAILEEFLNFSRPLLPLAQGEVDVRALCTDTAALHQGLAADRRVSIRVEGGEDLVVRCDRRKVRQILVNLLQNAIAASPAGGEIVIDAEAATVEGAPAVRIAVRDQGKGIAPEIAQRLFTPGATTKSGGSGLGLTVSRALARQHGGDLTLNNGVGGCVGELVLPRYGAPSREAA